MIDQSDNTRLPEPPSTFQVETSLSEELLKLSFEDRDKLQQEIHGVHCNAIDESDEQRWLALEEFDREINEWKHYDPTAWVLRNIIRTHGPFIERPNNCYVNDDHVRIRFLRCELFDVRKAVQRFISFLEFMSELFGDFAADRPIRISDFSRDELAVLSNSRNQFLPFRDRSGRAVYVGVGNSNWDVEVKLRYKIIMYLHWSASDDVETQMKGLVIVGWFFDEVGDSTWEKLRLNMKDDVKEYHAKQNKSLPVRIVCWHHFFMDTVFFRFLARLYAFNTDRTYRSIYKVHFGSQMELRYKLSSYGVPEDLLPFSHTGTVKFDNHRSFLSMRRAKIYQNPNNHDYREIVECPRSNDVIFRKGPSSKYNKGNEFYRKLLNEQSLEHFKGDKTSKYEITMSVIREVELRQGRFLEWKDNGWVVIANREYARKKIAAGFKQYNRNFKGKEAAELLEAINIALTVDDNQSKNITTNNEHQDKDSRYLNQTIESSTEAQKKYDFINNPAKRQKTNDKHEQCFGVCA